MMDSYIYILIALLPLAAAMVIVQKNPYQALIVRGILGAISAMLYAVLGGADVALTEALVGTMLAITLYAVAVRSSLVMRLGVLEAPHTHEPSRYKLLWDDLRMRLRTHHLRLELVPYVDAKALHQALIDREVHGICLPQNQPKAEPLTDCLITLRVQRLYDILTATRPPTLAQIAHLEVGDAAPLNLTALKETQL
ncbi:MAG: DUF4040 domain-containing protein [Leptolyngbyaceae cyanobacterium SM2_5_2]|nr:DUF4040 domain-containing protein [Leptolyngbyaceae cyanobacterium SM2_5_2]